MLAASVCLSVCLSLSQSPCQSVSVSHSLPLSLGRQHSEAGAWGPGQSRSMPLLVYNS